VKTEGLKRLVCGGHILGIFKFALCGVALALSLAVPEFCRAQCRETPTVLMDERTAETHLLARRDPELPTNAPALARVEPVTVLVTVDRQGAICEVRPLAGPQRLRSRAVRAVKKHWRYRPFLVDWKPVVARFPVTVRFARRKAGPQLTAFTSWAPLAGAVLTQ
jgi:hypothetical protein